MVTEKLRVTQYRLQWGTQLMTDTGQVATFSVVGSLSKLLGALQFNVCFVVCFNFHQQSRGLATGFLLCDFATLAGQ